MAFKILEQEELELLNAEERGQYERELKLYGQRTAFVEQMEMLENVRLEPYAPRLEAVSVIDETEVRLFPKSEYTVSLCEPVQKPDFQMIPFLKIEQVTPVLPYLPMEAVVRERHIDKIEKAQPALPLTNKAEAAVTFKLTERPQADIPEIIMPDLEIAPITASVKTQPALPRVQVSAAERIAFRQPERRGTELPRVQVSAAERIAFRQLERRGTELPNVAMPCMENIFWEETEPIQTDLPKISVKFSPERAEFSEPEKQAVNLPIVIQANISLPPVPKAERAAPELPGLPDISIQEKKFSRPEQLPPVLPAVPKLTLEKTVPEKTVAQVEELPKVHQAVWEEKLFEKTVGRAAGIPVCAGVPVCERHFKCPGREKPDAAAPAVTCISVKAFSWVKRESADLPEIGIMEIPDAYAKLKKYLAGVC